MLFLVSWAAYRYVSPLLVLDHILIGQNYLVYTNSLLFIDSGGNSRVAGVMLAFATFGVLLAGPGIVGFIPIMVVGALIYMLGIELMEEALVDTWGKLHRLEYITVRLSILLSFTLLTS